jgi:GNAT superfamily N-acetyltransferase
MDIIRPFLESDFGQTDGFCKYEGGEGLIYPSELWESNESFRRRIEQFPEGCLACANEQDQLIGYMFCHPWKTDSVVPLNCENLRIPKDADCFYIHDIAVVPSHRRKGIAKRFLDIAIDLARKNGFDMIKGVSVLGSHAYWEKRGFTVGEDIIYGGVKAKVIQMKLGEIP